METIRTPSRLHLSLIDMEGGLGRVDGGIGIALEEPCFEIGFEKAKEVRVSGENDPREVIELARKICSELNLEGANIEIKRAIPEHIGFGSKTQLCLAVAAGICRVYGIRRSLAEMALMVRRGGTSGVGVAAFESGGFILDGGHPSRKGFVPSRYSNAPPPPILARYDFPWHIVCAWPEGSGAHGEAEREIFDKNCPIPPSEVGRVSRLVLMKILPALIEGDISAFGEGINMLQKSGFKKIEVELQSREVQRLLRFMQKNSAGGGMSSFGPVCFGVCGSSAEARGLEARAREMGFNAMTTKANNKGAIWL